MGNHPNRSRRNRVVTYKIGASGTLARVDDASRSDLAISVTGVPADIRDASVMVALHRVVLLPTRGPWTVAWERLADAPQGAILRNCNKST